MIYLFVTLRGNAWNSGHVLAQGDVSKSMFLRSLTSLGPMFPGFLSYQVPVFLGSLSSQSPLFHGYYFSQSNIMLMNMNFSIVFGSKP